MLNENCMKHFGEVHWMLQDRKDLGKKLLSVVKPQSKLLWQIENYMKEF